MTDREPDIRNGEAPWSDFDAVEYWQSSYASVLPQDAVIIERASQFNGAGSPSGT
jgi:hypothetical protein